MYTVQKKGKDIIKSRLSVSTYIKFLEWTTTAIEIKNSREAKTAYHNYVPMFVITN